MERTVHSVVEKIAIRDFKENKEKLLARHFTSGEREEILTKPDQTAAGFLAVKKALIILCKAIIPQSSFSEQSFQLSHESNGAPCVISFPKLTTDNRKYSKKDFHISITHNRSNAYGLAALQEKGNE